MPTPDSLLDQVRFDDRGLVPAIVQDTTSRAVLMLAWMDAEALRRTLTTGRGTYWSRSRQTYWVKGETSGHTQHVIDVRLDCDADALLVVVDQVGPACHTGARSCFDATSDAASDAAGDATSGATGATGDAGPA
jgi:phosphoribosyl-AMP cyclohydrolase